MRIPVSLLSLNVRPLLLAALVGSAVSLTAQDAELTNYKSGIDVIWGGTKGVDYYEEYFYHDKLTYDAKVVYIKATTPITMAHNARNNAFYHVSDGGLQTIGVNGKDGVPNSGDEGIIRYKIDRDRQYLYKWSDTTSRTQTANVLPAYTGPFTLASLNYGPSDPGVPVVGTTGGNGGSMASKSAYYYRGIADTANVTGAGDEWHVLTYADDDNVFLRAGVNFVDQKFYASDAKTVLLVVNPKTPCFTARATGSGQFYTTPPKAYWTPKIVPQTTYISGTVNIELRDINGNNVFYRINGGSYTNAGSNTVILNQDNFANGTNTLEYYYAGNSAFTKTRIVVRNPTHPSLAEPHGNYLWQDAAGYATVLSRITRAPYLAYYNSYKGRTDQSGQPAWDSTSRRGLRLPQSQPITNAFVAKVQGWNYTASGSSKSHGRYAKEMILEFSRNTDPAGFEMQMSADASGNRELHAFGYNDSQPVVSTLFAYDLIAGNFRTDQVGSDGLSAIEDYFVRDRLAGFAYEAMQWGAGMTALGDPGMWGGARMMTSVSIAMILREYSTPYYGTSGFGTVQTTYPLCPYQNDQLTWKQALFDATAPKSAYPNLTWYTGLSDNGAFSLFLAAGQKVGVNTFTEGDWLVKNAYFSYGLMGRHLAIWANMSKMWANKTDPRLEKAIEKATKGTLLGAGDAVLTPGRFHMLTFLNSRWPNAVANNISWVQSLPSTDSNSDDKAMQDAGVFGFAWYDDQLSTPVSPISPSITSQPASSTVTAGASASFSVSASGTTPMTYQWRLNGSPIGGATNATYSIPSVSSGQAGTYSVVVSNTAGSATSGNATLTVNAAPPQIVAPSITTQPASSSVTEGATVSFSVSVTGTAPLAYQWRLNGSPITGAISDTYSIFSASSGLAGNYSVVVSNTAGSVTSANALLTVNPPPAVAPTITTQPANSTVTAGDSASFSVFASGTAPLSYQWRLSGSPIGGATSATYNIASASAGQAGTYSVVVSNAGGSVASATATLTVNALPPPASTPSIITQPANSTVTTGSSVSFVVAATGTAPLSYQWRLNGSPITGATGATYSIASASSGLAGNYSVVVSNAAGSVTSADATLTVNPAPPVAPTITTQPTGSAVSAGASASFTVAASGTPPLAYQWQFNGSPIGGATGGTYSIFSASASQAGNYSVVVSNAAGSVTSNNASLTVSATPPPVVAPTITTQPANSTVTAGTSASFSVTAAGSVPLAYQWQFNGAPIAGATSDTHTISSASAGQAGSYSVVVSNSAGSATSANATLTVNAAPPPSPSVTAPSDAKVIIK